MGDPPTLRLFITPTEPDPVPITIETLRGFSFTGIASPNATTTVEIPNTFEVVSSSERDKGIRVSAGWGDTVLLRSFASSSLDLFAGRCGVVACRFRSLSISPSLSCSITVIVNRSLLSPRASAVYTRTYIRLRTARSITQTRGVRRNALAMKTTLTPHLRICP